MRDHAHGGQAWFWEQFGRSFTDIERDVIETIATLTRLVTVMNLSGTHTGDFLGHAPTGRRSRVRNVQMFGFRDGKASDRWGSTDESGMLQQTRSDMTAHGFCRGRFLTRLSLSKSTSW